MKTVTINIINNKALRLFTRPGTPPTYSCAQVKMEPPAATDWATKYKGAMVKQPLSDIDNQLRELRNEWE